MLHCCSRRLPVCICHIAVGGRRHTTGREICHTLATERQSIGVGPDALPFIDCHEPLPCRGSQINGGGSSLRNRNGTPIPDSVFLWSGYPEAQKFAKCGEA